MPKKKKAVVVEDWQDQYIKWLSEIYGVSYSTMVRMCIASASMCYAEHMQKGFKPVFGMAKICKRLMEAKTHNKDSEILKILSDIAFDGRTAWEHRSNRKH